MFIILEGNYWLLPGRLDPNAAAEGNPGKRFDVVESYIARLDSRDGSVDQAVEQPEYLARRQLVVDQGLSLKPINQDEPLVTNVDQLRTKTHLASGEQHRF